jgi:hypothetical protein
VSLYFLVFYNLLPANQSFDISLKGLAARYELTCSKFVLVVLQDQVRRAGFQKIGGCNASNHSNFTQRQKGIALVSFRSLDWALAQIPTTALAAFGCCSNRQQY